MSFIERSLLLLSDETLKARGQMLLCLPSEKRLVSYVIVNV